MAFLTENNMCVNQNNLINFNTFNTEQQRALNLLQDDSYPNLLITGDAGTGKSTVIREYIRREEGGKRIIVTASTGFAASLLSGTTYYKAFGLRPGIEKEGDKIITIPENLANADIVIIDEVSMITAEMFDLLFQEITFIREHKHRYVKFVLVGDFYQLPPVTGNGYVNMHWLFESEAFSYVETVCLREKVRQIGDQEFARMLDLAKMGDESCIDFFNTRSSKIKFEDATFLCGRRDEADAICKGMLRHLPVMPRVIESIVTDREGLILKRKPKALPLQLEDKLMLKIGAKVRFTVNSPEGLYTNGTPGKVVNFYFDGGGVIQTVVVELLETGEELEVERVSIPLDIPEELYMNQFPLRLSYAITIHKAQGMTLDRINILPAGWEPGQLYVALSRAHNITDIYLKEPINIDMLKCDPRVINFYENIDWE